MEECCKCWVSIRTPGPLLSSATDLGSCAAFKVAVSLLAWQGRTMARWMVPLQAVYLWSGGTRQYSAP